MTRAAGSRADASASTYEHDAAGQLVERRPDGGAATFFEYDGSGRRVREYGEGSTARTAGTRWAGCVAVGDTRLRRVDALGELAEVDGTPSCCGTPPTRSRRWRGWTAAR